jgi:hypothetical protein
MDSTAFSLQPVEAVLAGRWECSRLLSGSRGGLINYFNVTVQGRRRKITMVTCILKSERVLDSLLLLLRDTSSRGSYAAPGARAPISK